MMVNPPKRGRESDETVDIFEKEQKLIMDSLRYKAKLVTERLNKMTRVSSNEVAGKRFDKDQDQCMLILKF